VALLIRLEDTGTGCRIGNICPNNTAYADDIALIGTDTVDTQILVNMVSDYAFMEEYKKTIGTSSGLSDVLLYIY
jgi:hypothetical protein